MSTSPEGEPGSEHSASVDGPLHPPGLAGAPVRSEDQIPEQPSARTPAESHSAAASNACPRRPPVHCIHCDSPISDRATVCPVCQKMQTRWREHVSHAATTVGLISGLLALGLVLFQFYDHWFKRLFVGDRLTMPAFYTNGRATVSNLGYRDVAIVGAEVQVTFESKDENGEPQFQGTYSTTYDINQVVKAGAIASFDVQPEPADISPREGTNEEVRTLIRTNGESPAWVALVETDPHFMNWKRNIPNLRHHLCTLQLILIPSGEASPSRHPRLDCIAIVAVEKPALANGGGDESTPH